MITIDLIDEHVDQSEKPLNSSLPRHKWRENAQFDPNLILAQGYHHHLLQAAHNARLAKASRTQSLSIEVQRFVALVSSSINTLAERYARRAVDTDIK